jgi:hypothetical protein
MSISTISSRRSHSGKSQKSKVFQNRPQSFDSSPLTSQAVSTWPAIREAVRNGRPSPVPVEQAIYVVAILEVIMHLRRESREIAIPSYEIAESGGESQTMHNSKGRYSCYTAR